MFVVPAVFAVSVPTAVAVWPDSAEEPPSLEGVAGMAEIQRESSIDRGSTDRAPRPDPSEFAPAPNGTPTPEPTEEDEEPEEEETETPEPEEEEEETEETEEPEPEPTPVGQRYVTTTLNVRTAPGTDADVVTVLERGAEVDITGESEDEWVEIIVSGEAAWVSGDYLSESEPAEEEEEEEGGLSMAECESGSEVESGLTPDAVRVHRAVCAQFPDVTSYGGLRSGGGEHSEGRALDIMVSNQSLGDQIAEWVREHYQELGVSEVIWAQRIWTVERSSEGWRWMEDRGSATENHYDHVHVTVYGDAGEL
ncbi:SH3 domain-containing protein [Actinobacteria bacterium YIM 96077]|uniref:SH3 domain-containing protein n=2 Tax=Phytoactinopolyspora halophila TaxID=1981511 RepID=A0A329QDH2_9ACTN|nr:SH3 domain-containing protein [Actinobacteria bacterium YIM 96077]RAW09302.1 SH3 domain-containing protein [Phytoactinopolyspora halophila]